MNEHFDPKNVDIRFIGFSEQFVDYFPRFRTSTSTLEQFGATSLLTFTPCHRFGIGWLSVAIFWTVLGRQSAGGVGRGIDGPGVGNYSSSSYAQQYYLKEA